MQHQKLLTVAVTALVLFTCNPAWAQWDVSTVSAPGSGLDDGMVIDADGNLYVSEYQGTVVRRVTPDGSVSTFASGFNAPNGLAIDADGNLYVANAFGGRISRVAPDGTVTQDFITGVANPSGLLFNAARDTLYVSHYGSSTISRVALSDPGNVNTWVSGSPLNGPIGLAMDENGGVYTGNYNNGDVFKISPAGALTKLESIQSFLGFLTLANGYLYATSYSGNRIYRMPLDGSSLDVIAGTGAVGNADGAGSSATFDGPNGIVATASGDTLFVSEFNTGTLRMLVSRTPTGVEESDVSPQRLIDLQSYPNPFRTSTTITFALTEPSRVSIDVYNVLGQRIRTLHLRPLRAGIQSIQWDGRDDADQAVPRGAYLFTVRAGDYVQSRMMLRQ